LNFCKTVNNPKLIADPSEKESNIANFNPDKSRHKFIFMNETVEVMWKCGFNLCKKGIATGKWGELF